MIRAIFSYDKEKREASMKVCGHAGQAKHGEDIVCASASILAYTLAQVIKAMEHNGDLAEPTTIDMESGDAVIVCRAKDLFLFAEVMYAFFVIETGYTLLAKNYPQFVEFIRDGEA